MNDDPTWLDMLYVLLMCAVMLLACGLMVSECVSLVVGVVR